MLKMQSSVARILESIPSKGYSGMPERVREMQTEFEALALAHELAPYLLAVGPLDRQDYGFSQVAEVIAHQFTDLDQREAELNKLMEDSNVPPQLFDVCYAFLYAGKYSGYMLGLAVGQLLAAGAFKGGARS